MSIILDIEHLTKMYEKTERKEKVTDKHFIYQAWITAICLSKDPCTQVAAIVTTKDFRQISLGYNGLPKDIEETKELWDKEYKHNLVVHAEVNAVLNSPFDTKGCNIFTTHRPCHKCMGFLVNAGIESIIYNEDYTNKQNEEVWNLLSKKFKSIRQIEDDKLLQHLKLHKNEYRLSNLFGN